MSTRRPSLARSGALSSVFVLYGAAAAFAASLIVSNAIGERGAGSFFNIMALFTIATSFSVFGADTGLVRTVSAQTARPGGTPVRDLVRFAAGPVLLLSALTGLAGVAWSLLAPDAGEATRTAVRIAAPFLVLAAAMTLVFGVLRGDQQVVRFTALQNGLLPTLRVGAVGAAVLLGGSMGLLAAAWTVPVLVVLVVGLPPVLGILRRDDARHQPGVPASEHRETRASFWSFSSARGVAALVEAVLEWVDVIVVGAVMGLAASGIYGAVNRCVRVGVMVEHTARVVTGPAISAALASDALERARRIFVDTTRALVMLAWPFYLTLMLFGPGILGIFGAGFPLGAQALVIICPAMMLAMSAGGVQSVLLMAGRSRWQLYNKLSSLAVAVALNLTLVPLWGLRGAATAWAAAVLIDCGLAAEQVHRRLGIRARPAELLPAAGLALGVVGLGGLLVRLLLGPGLVGLLMHAVAVCGAYLALLWILRRPLGLEAFLSARRRTG